MKPSRLPTVVVPVFNALAVTRQCLAALDRCSPDARVIIVNDASTEPGLLPLLRDWVARHPDQHLIDLPQNRGFVHAANRGAAEAEGDLVLLNSDAEVTPGWLDALGRCLASDRAIATATPWSNNAEIVSLPEFCQANPVPADADVWAAAVLATARGDYPELPTGVGFCMAIAGTAIQELGLFDEAAFGRGYGEENDFCFRARKAGWRNVLCEDAYVVHHGGQSFGPIGLRPDESSMQRLLAKHPDYLEQVSQWIERDPLAARRAEVLAYRAAHGSGKLTASTP